MLSGVRPRELIAGHADERGFDVVNVADLARAVRRLFAFENEDRDGGAEPDAGAHHARDLRGARVFLLGDGAHCKVETERGNRFRGLGVERVALDQLRADNDAENVFGKVIGMIEEDRRAWRCRVHLALGAFENHVTGEIDGGR